MERSAPRAWRALIACVALIATGITVASRLTPAAAAAGDLDTSFSTDGIILRDLGTSTDNGLGVVTTADNKVVVLGHGQDGPIQFGTAPNPYWELNRYTEAGELDSTFSSDGVVTPTQAMVDATFVPNDLVQRPDGKLLVVGRSAISIFQGNIAFAQFLADGSPDPDFGSSGFLVTSFDRTSPYTAALEQQLHESFTRTPRGLANGRGTTE